MTKMVPGEVWYLHDKSTVFWGWLEGIPVKPLLFCCCRFKHLPAVFGHNMLSSRCWTRSLCHLHKRFVTRFKFDYLSPRAVRPWELRHRDGQLCRAATVPPAPHTPWQLFDYFHVRLRLESYYFDYLDMRTNKPWQIWLWLFLLQHSQTMTNITLNSLTIIISV